MSSDQSICRTSGLDERVIVDLCSDYPEEIERAMANLPRALTEQEVEAVGKQIYRRFDVGNITEVTKQEKIAIYNLGSYALRLQDLVTAESVTKTLWQGWSFVKALTLRAELNSVRKGIIAELIDGAKK
jgi:hypothetical protein